MSDDVLGEKLSAHMRGLALDVFPPPDLVAMTHRRLRRHRQATTAARVGVLAVGVAAAVAVPLTRHGSQVPGGTRQPATVTALRDLPLTGPVVRLAGYAVALPAGFTATPGARAAGQPTLVATGRSGASVRMALSATQLLASGTAVRRVDVAGRRAEVQADRADGVVRLQVPVPSESGRLRWLVMVAHGLSERTVVAMAADAFGG